jgi:SNF2 family DNA or RNA helicase
LALAYESPVQVVSYALLHEVRAEGWDAIVFDEAHRLKNPISKQARAARVLMERNPRAVALHLTATLMPDDINDVWNLLDLLWPGRFGAYRGGKYVAWSFANRYAQKHEIEVGEKVYTQYKGLNPANAKELEHRLKAVSSRATKKEWRHVLPPFLVSTRKIEGRKYASIDEWLDKQGEDKLSAVAEWLEDAVLESSHTCILTHLRGTAQRIAEQIHGTYPQVQVFCITGEQSPEERGALLEQARKSPRAVLVATMHSVGIGIDLTKFTRALFAELYWRPETVIQALGRFWRLSSQEPASVEILCIKDSVDEQMAKNVLTKVSAINTVLPEGDSEARLEEAMGALANMTDEEALANLMEACG